MANTPRLGLRRPQPADNFVPDQHITANADILDAAAISTYGTMAGRPAANTVKEGTFYFAVDTGDVSRSDGTTWFTVTPGNRSNSSAGVTSTTVPASTDTKLLANTEQFDVGGDFASSRFTAPVKGIYRFSALVSAQAVAAGKNAQAYFTRSLGGSSSIFKQENGGAGSANLTIVLAVNFSLAASEWVELHGLHNDVVDRSFSVNHFTCELLAQLP